MPSWGEFIVHFGLKELILSVFIVAVIVLAREKRHIRRKND